MHIQIDFFVVAGAEQVGRPVHLELNLHLGQLAVKLGQKIGHHVGRVKRNRFDTQAVLTAVAHRCLKLPLDAQQLLRRVQVELAVRRELQRRFGPVEDLDLIFVFHGDDLLAERRLRHEQLFGRPRNAALQRNGFQIFKLAKGHNKTLLKLTG